MGCSTGDLTEDQKAVIAEEVFHRAERRAMRVQALRGTGVWEGRVGDEGNQVDGG